MFTKGHKINIGRKRSDWVKEKIRKGHLGKKMSLEARKKMSLAKKGKKPRNWGVVEDYFLHKKKTGGEFKKGTTWIERMGEDRAREMLISVSKRFKNKKQPIKQRIKKRLSQLGEKGSNWQGGITPINKAIRKSLEYKLWREAIFERDNYTCRFCGVKGGFLNADHIKRFSDYPKLRLAKDNGRTLCNLCHMTTDNYGNRRTLCQK